MVVVGKGVEGRLATLTPPLSTVRPLLPKPEHYSPIFHPKTLDITQNVQVYGIFCPPDFNLFLSRWRKTFIPGNFFHRYPPKKIKYGKPRFGEYTLTKFGQDTPNQT